jgi:DNA-binding response OmpR family regulator
MKSAGGVDTKIILVVEENVATREQLVELVRRLGFIAIPAADRESATVIARKLHVDLVILRVAEDLAVVASISELKRRRPETAVLALAQPDTLAEPLLRSAGVDAVMPAAGALIDLAEPIRRLLRM